MCFNVVFLALSAFHQTSASLFGVLGVSSCIAKILEDPPTLIRLLYLFHSPCNVSLCSDCLDIMILVSLKSNHYGCASVSFQIVYECRDELHLEFTKGTWEEASSCIWLAEGTFSWMKRSDPLFYILLNAFFHILLERWHFSVGQLSLGILSVGWHEALCESLMDIPINPSNVKKPSALAIQQHNWMRCSC